MNQKLQTQNSFFEKNSLALNNLLFLTLIGNKITYYIPKKGIIITLMQDNDAEKQKIAAGFHTELAEDVGHYRVVIPEANPIKKRQKLQCSSIFPLLPLPNFIFANQIVEPTNINNQSSNQNTQRLILPSTSLASLFRDPIFVYNERAQCKNNSDFGCIKVKYSESTVHKDLKEEPLMWEKNKDYSMEDQKSDEKNQQENLFIEEKRPPSQQKQLNLKSMVLEPSLTQQNMHFYESIHSPRKKNSIPRILKTPSKSVEMKKIDEKLTFTGNQQGIPISPECSQELKFESRFQSGNLCFVSRSPKQSNTYYLILTRDFNTSKCTQWFFFRAINNRIGKATFHILNFVKNYSVFENGMKICRAAKSDSFRWIRGCEEIKYRKTNIPIYQNGNPKNDKKNGNGTNSNVRCYYSLSFSYNFDKPNDEVYFAYCYPYTYSMLQNFMWKSDQNSPHFKRRNIATTPGNNCVDIVTITNFKQKEYKKRIIVITARVHPGETPSSFVCEGMMKYLLGDTPEAVSLRDSFVFKFIPMLNPDGVINGSYRCSLSGYDLNRVWHIADKVSHPQIYATRKNIFQINQRQPIFLTVDLHAHSKKKGIFMYGSQNRNNPYLCRQIPFLLWKNISLFNYYQCNFAMRTGREGTSRLFLYQQLGLNYSYTMQHSFCGPSKERLHFTSKDYANFGINFLQTLNKYFYILRKKINNEEQSQQFRELYANKELIKVGEAEDGDSSSDQQLDSSPLKPKAKPAFTQERKLIAKRQVFRMSENSIKPNKFARSLEKKNKIQPTNSFREPTIVKFMHKTRFQQTINKPIPIVGPGPRESQDQISSPAKRQRACFSSMTNSESKYFLADKKMAMRETFRYEEEEEINSLTNLFLPSLTSASYKKYNRKNQNSRNMVYIGKNLIEDAIVIKEEIKSSRRKKMTWKDHARSFL